MCYIGFFTVSFRLQIAGFYNLQIAIPLFVLKLIITDISSVHNFEMKDEIRKVVVSFIASVSSDAISFLRTNFINQPSTNKFAVIYKLTTKNATIYDIKFII